MSLHLVCVVMHIDHQCLDASFPQRLYGIVNHRLSTNFDQGLGHAIGNGPHSRAQSGREDHGLSDGHLAYVGDSDGLIPTRAHQARKGASTGCSKAIARWRSVRGRWAI